MTSGSITTIRLQYFFHLSNGNSTSLNSNFPVPLSLRPLATIFVLSVSMNLTTLDISGIVLCVSFCDWLNSLSISSWFIPVIAGVRISFFQKVTSIPLYI